MRGTRKTLLSLALLIALALAPALWVGCSDQTAAQVTPMADFGLDNDHPLVGEEIHFTDRSQGSPTEWYWDFGDGNSSEQQNPSHAYAEPGFYSVTLKAGNSAGSDARVWSALVTVGEAPQPANFTITDDLGKTFSFDEPVHSIISLAPSNTEIMYAVGAGYKMVGRTDYCNYPIEAAAVDSVGSFWAPDKEKILIKSPDVVLATGAHAGPGGVTEWLEEKGVTVVTLLPETLTGILDDILMVGKLTGLENRAEILVDDMQATIDYVRGKTAGLTQDQKPSVLHVTWHNPLWTAGKGTFMDTIIEMAGGVNLIYDEYGDVQVGMDTVLMRDPDVMTVVTGSGSATSTPYEYMTAADSPLKVCSCYVNHRIYMINADLASRPGPRIIEALEWYAKFIHPELFGNP